MPIPTWYRAMPALIITERGVLVLFKTNLAGSLKAGR